MLKKNLFVIMFVFMFLGTGRAEMVKIADSVALPVIPPAWSPDGAEIAFISEGRDLYTVSPDGKNLRRLTLTPEFERNPSYTANGAYLTTSYTKEITEDSSVSVVLYFCTFPYGEVDSSMIKELPIPYVVAINSPNYRGTVAILFGTVLNKGLLVMIQGGPPIILSESASEYGPPSFSRNDEYIAFTSLENGIEQIAVVNLMTGEKKFLTDTFFNAYFPSFSPDGEQIVFTYNKDGNNDLWLINKDGSGLTQLTKTPYHENTPVWSPDGKKIAFESNKDGKWALYVMDAPPLKLPPRQDLLIVENISYDSEIAIIKEKLFYLAPRIRNQSNEEIKTALCMYDIKKKVESVLTSDTENLKDFVVAPSGDRVAFRLENNSVWVINNDGKGRAKIATENFYNELGLFTPDGKQFIFVSARSDDDGDGEMTYLDKLGIYSVNTDGKNLRQLEPPEFWTDILDISKDGSMILFSNKIDEVYYLYLLDLKNNKKIKIAENCASGRFLLGDKKIYFTKEIPTDDGWLTESYVSDIDGNNIQKMERLPIYSNNGRQTILDFDTTLILVENDGKNQKVIWQGKLEDDITEGTTGSIYFSPDDRYIVFMSELRKASDDPNILYSVEGYLIHQINLLDGKDKTIFSSDLDPDAFFVFLDCNLYGLTADGKNIIFTKKDFRNRQRSIHFIELH